MFIHGLLTWNGWNTRQKHVNEAAAFNNGENGLLRKCPNAHLRESDGIAGDMFFY